MSTLAPHLLAILQGRISIPAGIPATPSRAARAYDARSIEPQRKRVDACDWSAPEGCEALTGNSPEGDDDASAFVSFGVNWDHA